MKYEIGHKAWTVYYGNWREITVEGYDYHDYVPDSIRNYVCRLDFDSGSSTTFKRGILYQRTSYVSDITGEKFVRDDGVVNI